MSSSAGNGCGDLSGLLRVYHGFLRVLAFELLPQMTQEVLGGAGFGPLARLFAGAARLYAEQYLGPEERRDPLRLLEIMSGLASCARDAIGEEPLFSFTYRYEDGRLIVELPHLGPEGDKLTRARQAVLLGIVAGLYEAVGHKVYVVTNPEQAKRYLGKGLVAYLEKHGDSARIVVEGV